MHAVAFDARYAYSDAFQSALAAARQSREKALGGDPMYRAGSPRTPESPAFQEIAMRGEFPQAVEKNQGYFFGEKGFVARMKGLQDYLNASNDEVA